ncbi:MAG: hypothetical protein ACYCOU_24725 [Sulfobacillus sp.]
MAVLKKTGLSLPNQLQLSSNSGEAAAEALKRFEKEESRGGGDGVREEEGGGKDQLWPEQGSMFATRCSRLGTTWASSDQNMVAHWRHLLCRRLVLARQRGPYLRFILPLVGTIGDSEV